ncbi:MAG: class I SAM-dependent methyltransferase [Methylococcales bacterium]|nr:class I SAM-dependent methyltransferase [Methylococcales bacterium]
MSKVGAYFFAYIQGAAFYRELHKHAVTLLPEGAGRTWLDIGCGPGLVPQLATEHGYLAFGRDIDPEMIAIAQRLAKRRGIRVKFEIGGIGSSAPYVRLVDVFFKTTTGAEGWPACQDMRKKEKQRY